jgi:Na+/melibiose symporter-like transporter
VSGPRRLSWGGRPDPPITRHPYRDTAIVYGCLAVVVVLVAWATGGGFAKALVVAGVFFVIATGWSFYRIHRRFSRARRAFATDEARS